MPTPLNRREALVGILTSSAALLAASLTNDNPLFAKEPNTDQSTARPQITISKETTYITEPLRPDGYPDYVAALNLHCSRGVTPENNAAVPFWQAMGPGKIEPERREHYFKMLGITPLPEKGEYFRTADDQITLRKTTDNKLVDEDHHQGKSLYQQMTQAARRPWSRQEFPVWAEWLDVNERPIALLTEASKRPRRYDPWFHTKRGQDISFSLPAIELSRDVARAFVLRAMLRMHDDKTNESWMDLLACHRLARLIGQGPTLVEALVAMTLDVIANLTGCAFIEHVKLPAAKIVAMRQQLASLPPLCNFADAYDLGERFGFLSSMLAVIGKSPAERNRLLAEAEPGGLGTAESTIFKPILEEMSDDDIDWDAVLRLGNSWYDRWAKVLRISDPIEQRKANEDLDKEHSQLLASIEAQKPLRQLPADERRKAAANRLVQACIAVLSTPSICVNVANRAAVTFDLTQLAFALAAYRADHKVYPEKLSQLSAKYIDRIPKDVFSNGDLHYSRRDKGYLLYSVGLNGRNDKGRGPYDDGNSDKDEDDLVVRVPSTKP